GGFGASTNAFAAGCELRNLSKADGLGASGPLALIARKKSLNSSDVATGKPLKDRTTISVWDPSASVNFTAMPRGISAVSGTVGNPDPAENRTVKGIGLFCFLKVSGLAHGRRRSARRECAFQYDALRVIRTRSRMRAEHGVERVDQLLRHRLLTSRRLLSNCDCRVNEA